MEINAPHIFVQTTLSWPCMDMPVWSVKNVLGKCQPVNKGCQLFGGGDRFENLSPKRTKYHNKEKIHGDGAGFSPVALHFSVYSLSIFQ